MLPKALIESNVRASGLGAGDKGYPLEIDIFIRDLNIGFEYQDPHHYFPSSYGTTTLEEYPSGNDHSNSV